MLFSAFLYMFVFLLVLESITPLSFFHSFPHPIQLAYKHVLPFGATFTFSTTYMNYLKSLILFKYRSQQNYYLNGF